MSDFYEYMDELKRSKDQFERMRREKRFTEFQIRSFEAEQVRVFYGKLMSIYLEKLDSLPRSLLLNVYSMLKSRLWPPQLGNAPLAIRHHLFWYMVDEHILKRIEKMVGKKAIMRMEKPADMTDQQFEDWWDSFVLDELLNRLKSIKRKMNIKDADLGVLREILGPNGLYEYD